MTVSSLKIAMELGADKWLLAFATQAAEKPRFRQMPARNLIRLDEEIAKVIPSKKTAPVLGGKTASVGAAGMSWRARRAGVAPLGTRVNAWSNGRPDVLA